MKRAPLTRLAQLGDLSPLRGARFQVRTFERHFRIAPSRRRMSDTKMFCQLGPPYPARKAGARKLLTLNERDFAALGERHLEIVRPA